MFPVGIGLRDPRSQKRDLGHPSVSPFDIAEGTSFVISLPTRLSESAARDDKKERVVVKRGQLLKEGAVRYWFSALTTAVTLGNGPLLTTTLSFLSSRAYPDFLPHSSDRRHLCGSPQREPHAVDRSHNSR